MRHDERMRIALPLLALVLLAGCGGDDEGAGGERTPSEPPPGALPPTEEVRLELRVDDGEGQVMEATLVCAGGEVSAGGYLDDARAASLCRSALQLDELLIEQPPEDQVCTQIFGGPQTARVTGTLAGEELDRRLSRENGCRIAEWDRLQRAGLLPGP